MKIEDKKISDFIDKIAIELEKKDKIEWEEIIKIFGGEDNYYEFGELLDAGEDYEISILCPRKGESGGALPIDELLDWDEDAEKEDKINPFTPERTKEISSGAELTKKEVDLLQEKLDERSQQSASYQYYPYGDRCIVYKFTTLSGNTVLFTTLDWSGEGWPEVHGFFKNEQKLRQDLNKTYFLSS